MAGIEGILLNEPELQCIRHLMFPLIKNKIITGYNVYNADDVAPKKSPIIAYLHSNLTPHHAHYQELVAALSRDFETKSPADGCPLLAYREIRSRLADYLTLPQWEDPFGMRYFSLDGKEVEAQSAKSESIPVVGESIQYDLEISLERPQDIRKVLTILKKHGSKYRLTSWGGLKRPLSENASAIIDAWEIPLLTIRGHLSGATPRDFVRIRDTVQLFPIGGNQTYISTLTHNTSPALAAALDTMRISYRQEDIYALRAFVREYLDSN